MDDQSLNPPRMRNGLRPVVKLELDTPLCGGIMP